MSALSVEWLADTLLWTAALIALVLVLRRPTPHRIACLVGAGNAGTSVTSRCISASN